VNQASNDEHQGKGSKQVSDKINAPSAFVVAVATFRYPTLLLLPSVIILLWQCPDSNSTTPLFIPFIKYRITMRLLWSLSAIALGASTVAAFAPVVQNQAVSRANVVMNQAVASAEVKAKQDATLEALKAKDATSSAVDVSYQIISCIGAGEKRGILSRSDA